MDAKTALETAFARLTAQLQGRSLSLLSVSVQLEKELSVLLDGSQPNILPVLSILIDSLFSGWFQYGFSTADYQGFARVLSPDRFLVSYLLAQYALQRIQHPTLTSKQQQNFPETILIGLFRLIAGLSQSQRQWTHGSSEAACHMLLKYCEFFVPHPLTSTTNLNVFTCKSICGPGRQVTHLNLLASSHLAQAFLGALKETLFDDKTKKTPAANGSLTAFCASPPSLSLDETFWASLNVTTGHMVSVFVEAGPVHWASTHRHPPAQDALVMETCSLVAQKSWAEELRVPCLELLWQAVSTTGEELSAAVLNHLLRSFTALTAPWTKISVSAAPILQDLIPLTSSSKHLNPSLPDMLQFWTPYILNQAVVYDIFGAAFLKLTAQAVVRMAHGRPEDLDLANLLASLQSLAYSIQPLTLKLNESICVYQILAQRASGEDLQGQAACIKGMSDATLSWTHFNGRSALWSSGFKSATVVPLLRSLIALKGNLTNEVNQANENTNSTNSSFLGKFFFPHKVAERRAVGPQVNLLEQLIACLKEIFRISPDMLQPQTTKVKQTTEDMIIQPVVTPGSTRKKKISFFLPDPTVQSLAIQSQIDLSDDDLLPRWHEIPALVPLTHSLETFLNDCWLSFLQSLRERVDSGWIDLVKEWRFRMRWVASKPNLACVLLGFLVWYLVWS